jgi:Leucine-rich repeat (LRR) protein
MSRNDPLHRIHQIKDETERWAIKSLLDIIAGSFGMNFVISEGRVIELQMVASGLSAIPRQIKEFRFLKRLHLEANQIKKLRVIENLPSIEFLDISQNQLSDLSLLAQLPLLKSLNVSENQLLSLDSINQIKSLESLNLANNKITEIIPLSNLVDLRYLDLSGNPITSISNLHTLDKLIQIKLKNKYIKGEEEQILEQPIEKIKNYCRIKEKGQNIGN